MGRFPVELLWLCHYETRYDELVEQGEKLLAVIETKSFGYRNLCYCKTCQKVFECFRNWQGVFDYCKIRSLLSTAKNRKQNLLDTLASLFSEQIPAGQ